MLRCNMTIARLSAGARFHPECLFRPRSVAVIGADTSAGAQVLGNLRGGVFRGAVLPVAPDMPAVAGVLAYADVAALPIAPDLAVICGDAPDLAFTYTQLAARGCYAAIVVGMASARAEGGLRGLARRTGVRSLGPGSFGMAVPGIGLNATMSHLVPRAGRVALVSQSAALCRAVLDWAEPNGVGFSHVVGIGGNDDIGFGLVLDWLSRDAGTGAILLDIRRLKDSRRFLSAARAAARLRPVVAIRAGGMLADPSGQADDVMEAALHRSGILCVTHLEDLLAAAETLTRARPLRREGLAIVTNAIGPAQLAADAALRDGLALARLEPATRGVLNLALPADPALTPDGGGLLYVGLDQPIRLAETAALLGGAREVGGVLVVHSPTGPGDAAGMAALAAAGTAMKVPLLVCAMGETTGAGHRRLLAEAGVPAFASPEQAVRGFRHLMQNRANRAAARELPPSAVLRLAPDIASVRRIFAAVRRNGRLTLTQDEALGVLAAHGMPTVPCRMAASAQDAAVAAEMLGFPVVLKRRRVLRPDNAGTAGLALDLHDAAEVRAAGRLLAQRNPADESGFLVQRQVGRARELRLRVAEDAVFGPVIAFGQGGTAADLLGDVAVDLPPLNLPLAHALIGRTRVAATLAALHDQPAADSDAVADALVRISQLVVDFPELAELDVNPLFVDAHGVVAADAWIRLRAADAPPGRLAIPPYPGELAAPFTVRARAGHAGETLLVRPIRPEDAEAHGAFFQRLSPDDIRYRFFSALRELSAEQMARMTQVDYEREMAFVAVREASQETVGVARLVREAMDSDTAEFAVVIQPDMKGCGVARHLMERIIAWGRLQGIGMISGQVLADNAPMLAFMRALGFAIHRLPDEDDVVEARLALV